MTSLGARDTPGPRIDELTNWKLTEGDDSSITLITVTLGPRSSLRFKRNRCLWATASGVIGLIGVGLLIVGFRMGISICRNRCGAIRLVVELLEEERDDAFLC